MGGVGCGTIENQLFFNVFNGKLLKTIGFVGFSALVINFVGFRFVFVGFRAFVGFLLLPLGLRLPC